MSCASTIWVCVSCVTTFPKLFAIFHWLQQRREVTVHSLRQQSRLHTYSAWHAAPKFYTIIEFDSFFFLLWPRSVHIELLLFAVFYPISVGVSSEILSFEFSPFILNFRCIWMHMSHAQTHDIGQTFSLSVWTVDIIIPIRNEFWVWN